MVPIAYEFEAQGRRCSVTSLECWQNALVLHYREFAPSAPSSSAEEEGAYLRERLAVLEFRAAVRSLSYPDREEALRALEGIADVQVLEEALEALRGRDLPDLGEVLKAVREADERARREGRRGGLQEEIRQLALRLIAPRRLSETYALQETWELHDDVGTCYRWAGGGRKGNDQRAEGTVVFNPSLSPDAKEITFVVPHGPDGGPLARITVPLRRLYGSAAILTL